MPTREHVRQAEKFRHLELQIERLKEPTRAKCGHLSHVVVRQSKVCYECHLYARTQRKVN